MVEGDVCAVDFRPARLAVHRAGIERHVAQVQEVRARANEAILVAAHNRRRAADRHTVFADDVRRCGLVAGDHLLPVATGPDPRRVACIHLVPGRIERRASIRAHIRARRRLPHARTTVPIHPHTRNPRTRRRRRRRGRGRGRCTGAGRAVDRRSARTVASRIARFNAERVRRAAGETGERVGPRAGRCRAPRCAVEEGVVAGDADVVGRRVPRQAQTCLRLTADAEPARS